MSNIRLAKRYAEGLWDYAISVQEEEVLIQETRSVIDLIKESRDFRIFLKSPVIETDKKIGIAKEIFKSYSKTFQNFIIILLKHKREAGFNEILEQVLVLNNLHKGLKKAVIISAIPLEKDIIAKILDKSKEDISKIIVENIVDESIIGGYILRMDDHQVDASVRAQLGTIKTQFKEKVF